MCIVLLDMINFTILPSFFHHQTTKLLLAFAVVIPKSACTFILGCWQALAVFAEPIETFTTYSRNGFAIFIPDFIGNVAHNRISLMAIKTKVVPYFIHNPNY